MANGTACLTLRSGNGGIGWWPAGASCLWQSKHIFFTLLAIRLTPIIQNWFLSEVNMVATPACFNNSWWNLTIKTDRWHLGKIMGLRSSYDSSLYWSLPRTRSKPSESMKGLCFAIEEPLWTAQPFLRASNSRANSNSWTFWMSFNFSNWSSLNVNSPDCFTDSCLRLPRKRYTQATTRIALLKEPHLSTSNVTSGFTLEGTSITLASSSLILSEPVTSTVLDGVKPEVMNGGPCNHCFEFINSLADTPLVSKSAGFCSPGQCDHLLDGTRDWIAVTRFTTNSFHLLGSLLIQANTNIESDQHVDSTSMGSLNVYRTKTVKRAQSTAPSNSNLGNVTFFKGATFDFAATREVTVEPSISFALMYTQAP